MRRPIFVTENLREARLQVCEDCPLYLRRIPSILSQCTVCNCFMEAKTWMARIGREVVDCPKGKWDGIPGNRLT